MHKPKEFLKLVLLACLFAPYFAFNQGSPQNSNNINQKLLKDYAIVRLSYAYLEEKKAQDELSENEKRAINDFDSLYAPNGDLLKRMQDSINLARVDDFFTRKENNWHNNGKQVFDALKIYIHEVNSLKNISFQDINKIFLNIDPKLNKKGELTYLHKTVRDLKGLSSKIQSKTPEPTYTNNISKKKQQEHFDGIWFWTTILLSIIIVIEIILLILSSKKIKLLGRSNHQLSQKYKSYKNTKNQESRMLQARIANLELENRELKEQIKKPARSTLGNLKGNVDLAGENENQIGPKEVKPSTKPFYLSVPIQENKFNLEDKVYTPDHTTLYKFDGKSQGIFTLHIGSSTNIETPLSSHNIYFKPVCKYENNYLNSTHRQIQVLEPGEYKISENAVIVTKKIRIKFY